jgi:hypothetical protein
MPDDQNTPSPSTQDIAQRGEAIYKEKYQEEFEKSCNGKFVAVNVNTGDATVADTSSEAIRIALEKDPSGLFHLMRVGYQAAFEAGWYMTCAS